MRDYGSMAAALYDGGWRAEDKEQLQAEYDLTDEDVEQIVDLLAAYDAQARRGADPRYKISKHLTNCRMRKLHAKVTCESYMRKLHLRSIPLK